jgi:hypothetical protein
LAAGLDTYRSTQFAPSSVTATHYNLAMNASNQVGHGGDSGGPTIVTVNGVGVGIAGVQSSCSPQGYIMDSPSADWLYATGINFCSYVSTEPFWDETRRATSESPQCSLVVACTVPIIVDAALRAAN